MHALPLVLSTLAALATAPSLVTFLTEGGHVRTNYAGARIPCPLGLLVPAAAVVALVPLALLYGLFDEYRALDVPGSSSCSACACSGSPTTRTRGPRAAGAGMAPTC